MVKPCKFPIFPWLEFYPALISNNFNSTDGYEKGIWGSVFELGSHEGFVILFFKQVGKTVLYKIRSFPPVLVPVVFLS